MRSGASSKSKPPKPPVFFLDRLLGKKVIPAALRQAGVEVHIHDDHFPVNARDQDWLPVVGERGWIVLTKDQRIRYRELELAAVRMARVGLFTLTAKALPGIRHFVARNSTPFIAKITRSASVSMWIGRQELQKRYGR